MIAITYNQIKSNVYIGIVTVLDYEISVRKFLSKLTIDTKNRPERKVLVDMALKTGINEYRYVIYNISNEGRIILSSGQYTHPSDSIQHLANSFISQHQDILPNSMLPRSVQ